MKKVFLLLIFLVLGLGIFSPNVEAQSACGVSLDICTGQFCQGVAICDGECFTSTCNPCDPNFISCQASSGCCTDGFQKQCSSTGNAVCIPPAPPPLVPSFEFSLGKGYRNSQTGQTVQVFGADLGGDLLGPIHAWSPSDIEILNAATLFDVSSITPFHETYGALFKGRNLVGGSGDYVISIENRRLRDNYLIAKFEQTFSDPGIGFFYPAVAVENVVGYLPCETNENGGYSVSASLSRGGVLLPQSVSRIDFTVTGISNPFSPSPFVLTTPIQKNIREPIDITVRACGNNRPNWGGGLTMTTGHNTGISALQYERWNSTQGVWERQQFCFRGGSSPACTGSFPATSTNTWTTSESTPGTYFYRGIAWDINSVHHSTDPPFSRVEIIGQPTLIFPSDRWQRLWYATSGSSPLFVSSNFLGEGPNESSLRFDTNWGSGPIAHGRSDSIGFKSGRSFTVGTPGVYSFIIGSDDGARLEIGGVQVANQWGDAGFRTTTGSVALNVAGTYHFLFEYYENTGNARVSFSPAMHFQTSATNLTQGEPVTLTASCLGLCEGRAVSFQISSPFLPPRPEFQVASCTISGGTCSVQMTRNGTSDETFSLFALLDINSNSIWDSEDQSNVIGVTWASCKKTQTPISNSSNITLQNGMECSVSIKHIGVDAEDPGFSWRDISNAITNVSYESLQSGSTHNIIEMSDDPPACDMDLEFRNSWFEPIDTFRNFDLELRSTTSLRDKDTGHELGYGYEISSSNCVLQNAVQVVTASCPVTAVFEKQINDRTARRYVSTVDCGSRGNSLFTYDFDFEKCTTDAHCTPGSGSANSDANINTQKCNVGIPNNFLQNTCIDSVPPTITIGEIKRTHSGLLGSKTLLTIPETPGTDPQDRQWLRDGIYEISVTVDPVGGSAVDTSFRPVTIRSIGTDNVFGPHPITGIDDDKVGNITRTTANKFNVWVGPSSSSLNDCVKQEAGQCSIYVYARDLAGNDVLIIHDLNIDFTPPTAQ